MRDEMIGAVVRRAMEHPEFRQRLIDDPKGALDDHGFALEPDDFQEIEKISRNLGAASAGDIEQQLVTVAEKYGINPSRKS